MLIDAGLAPDPTAYELHGKQHFVTRPRIIVTYAGRGSYGNGYSFYYDFAFRDWDAKIPQHWSKILKVGENVKMQFNANNMDAVLAILQANINMYKIAEQKGDFDASEIVVP